MRAVTIKLLKSAARIWEVLATMKIPWENIKNISRCSKNLKYQREEIFTGINFREFVFGHFAGINLLELGFTEDFAGINFRELSLTKDLAGINFHESAFFKDFAGP